MASLSEFIASLLENESNEKSIKKIHRRYLEKKF